MARILLVEMDPLERVAVMHLLETSGHEVVNHSSRGNGNGSGLPGGPFDVIVANICPPHEDGLRNLLMLHRRFPAAKVIAVSGDECAGAVLAVGRAIGAVRTLQKPFSFSQLMATIEA